MRRETAGPASSPSMSGRAASGRWVVSRRQTRRSSRTRRARCLPASYPRRTPSDVARVRLEPFAVATATGRQGGRHRLARPSDAWCSSRTAAAERASTTRRCTSCRASAGRRPGRWLPALTAWGVGSTDGCTAPPCLPGPNEWFVAFLGRPATPSRRFADQRCPKWWARGSAATTSGVSATRRASAERLSSPETRMLRFRSTRSKRPRASRSGSARTIARCRS